MTTRRDWEIQNLRQDLRKCLQEMFQWMEYLKTVPYGKIYWKKIQSPNGEPYEYLYLQHAVPGKHPFQMRVPEEHRDAFLKRVELGNFAQSRVKYLRRRSRNLYGMLHKKMQTEEFTRLLERDIQRMLEPKSIQAMEAELRAYDSSYKIASFYSEFTETKMEDMVYDICSMFGLPYEECDGSPEPLSHISL